MLKHNIEFKGREPDKKVRELIEHLISKLERKVKNFSPCHSLFRSDGRRGARRTHRGGHCGWCYCSSISRLSQRRVDTGRQKLADPGCHRRTREGSPAIRSAA